MEWIPALLFTALVVGALVVANRLVYRRMESRLMHDIRSSAEAFRTTGALPPVPSPRVTVTEAGVETKLPGRRRERVAWPELIEVAVRTTTGGPWREDAFVLLGRAGGGGVVVPASETSELLTHLQRLPGFDNEMFIQAVTSTHDELFVCWRRVDRPA